MIKPEISIILPTYNRMLLLGECMQSLMQQSFQDFEIIVIDDCSTDDTPEFLENQRKMDGRIRVIRLDRNQGCNVCYNTGINQATGRYIAIMDDDDLALPGRLEMQKEFLDCHQEVGIVGALVRYFDENGFYNTPVPAPSVGRTRLDNPDFLFRQLFLNKLNIPNPTLMARNQVLSSFSFPPGRAVGGDTTLLMQMAAKQVKIHLLPEVLVFMRRSSDHQHMTGQIDDTHAGRLSRLAYMTEWLNKEGITRFDSLQEQAKKNIHTLHDLSLATRQGPVKRIVKIAQCFLHNPVFMLEHGIHSIPLYLEKRTRRRSRENGPWVP